MNYWQTVALVTVLSFFGAYAGKMIYWKTRGNKRGYPRPTWGEAFDDAFTAAVSAAVALMIYAK